MAEIINCPQCEELINLELDIYRIGKTVHCKKCHREIHKEYEE